MSVEGLQRLAAQLSKFRHRLHSIHLAGGEPFIRFDLLVEAVRILVSNRLPLAYVETNAFWATSDRVTREKLEALREAGLRGILISVSPFHLENVPFERTERAIHIAQQVFGSWGVLLFTWDFYQSFRRLGLRGTVPFEEYRKIVPPEWLATEVRVNYQFVPNGRGVFKLCDLFEKRPARAFFSESCRANLTYPGHVHIDLYGNYIGGLCAGISLGNGFELERLYDEGVELSERPILRRLVEENLGALARWAVREFGYRERPEGYVAKCHLCADIRRHLYECGFRSPDLAPEEFYQYLLVNPIVKK